jgi:hypothetical protein
MDGVQTITLSVCVPGRDWCMRCGWSTMPMFNEDPLPLPPHTPPVCHVLHQQVSWLATVNRGPKKVA